MEIGPFSWAGNEKQMWFGSWGADSCGVRELRLHEESRDYGYKNSLKPPRLEWGVGGVQPRPGEPSPTPDPAPPWEPLRFWKGQGEPGGAGGEQVPGCCAFLLAREICGVWFLLSAQSPALKRLPRQGDWPSPGGCNSLPPRVGLIPPPRPANTFTAAHHT